MYYWLPYSDFLLPVYAFVTTGRRQLMFPYALAFRALEVCHVAEQVYFLIDSFRLCIQNKVNLNQYEALHILSEFSSGTSRHKVFRLNLFGIVKRDIKHNHRLTKMLFFPSFKFHSFNVMQ